jgi:hypothetical protein
MSIDFTRAVISIGLLAIAGDAGAPVAQEVFSGRSKRKLR